MVIIFGFCHLVGMSSILVNPVLYGYLNKNFRSVWNWTRLLVLDWIAQCIDITSWIRPGTRRRRVALPDQRGMRMTTVRRPNDPPLSLSPSRRESVMRRTQDSQDVGFRNCQAQVQVHVQVSSRSGEGQELTWVLLYFWFSPNPNQGQNTSPWAWHCWMPGLVSWLLRGLDTSEGPRKGWYDLSVKYG